MEGRRWLGSERVAGFASKTNPRTDRGWLAYAVTATGVEGCALMVEGSAAGRPYVASRLLAAAASEQSDSAKTS